MIITTLIIDDERLAREEMRYLISQYSDFQIIGEAALMSVAVEKINSLRPDVIFLDISLPGSSGFDVLAASSFIPQVVFVTAYDEYAIRAFEENALDYLLKPIRQLRMDKTVDKIRKVLNINSMQSDAEAKIFIKDGQKCYFIAYKAISHITAFGNYAKFHFDRKTCLMYQSLRKLEERLPSYFFRANRQEIINLNYIVATKWEKEVLIVTLHQDVKILFSERNAILFRQRFG